METAVPHPVMQSSPAAHVLSILTSRKSSTEAINTLLAFGAAQLGSTSLALYVPEAPRLWLGHNAPPTVSENTLQGIFKAAGDESVQLPSEWIALGHSSVFVLNVKNAKVGVLLASASAGITNENRLNLLQPILDGLSILVEQLMMAARHEKLLRNQYEFVRVVTHDLRSPLTSMHGFASMLEGGTAGELNEKQLHYISKVVAGTTQLASLIENIADAGRFDPETGFYEMERMPIDPNDIVRKVTSNYILPTEKSELKLRVSTSDQVPIINADSNMIERATMNLVDNAIKYTPNGGDIVVGARVEHGRLVIFVQDTGYGISQENLKKLFQRHVRLRRPEHKLVKGSGLGLFIVRSVALRHGGDAFVQSVEGQGSTFGISLPLGGENMLVG